MKLANANIVTRVHTHQIQVEQCSPTYVGSTFDFQNSDGLQPSDGAVCMQPSGSSRFNCITIVKRILIVLTSIVIFMVIINIFVWETYSGNPHTIINFASITRNLVLCNCTKFSTWGLMPTPAPATRLRRLGEVTPCAFARSPQLRHLLRFRMPPPAPYRRRRVQHLAISISCVCLGDRLVLRSAEAADVSAPTRAGQTLSNGGPEG
jgi:hypothetical protein